MCVYKVELQSRIFGCVGFHKAINLTLTRMQIGILDSGLMVPLLSKISKTWEYISNMKSFIRIKGSSIAWDEIEAGQPIGSDSNIQVEQGACVQYAKLATI